MIVEISGVGYRNMGAQLMLAAAHDQLLTWGNVDEVAIGFRIGTRAQRRASGCTGVLRVNSERRPWANRLFASAVHFVPSVYLQRTGMRKPSMVHALLDASGFAFGDQWGDGPSRLSGRVFAEYAHRGKRVVLLPQAFGPFSVPTVASAARQALECSDLHIRAR